MSDIGPAYGSLEERVTDEDVVCIVLDIDKETTSTEGVTRSVKNTNRDAPEHHGGIGNKVLVGNRRLRKR